MFNEIVQARDVARRNHDKQKLSTYTVILGEIQRSLTPTFINGEKTYNGTDVIAVIKSLVKNWKASPSTSNQQDIVLAEQLLPQQLTQYQLTDIKLTKDFNNIGEFMSHLKMHYAGRYDGKLAKQVWDE